MKKMRFFKLIILILLMCLITLPRFNWRELPFPLNQFVGIKPFDIEQYEKYVDYFRGNYNLANQLEGPFTYRPLVPLFASILPFKPLTSINLINLLFLTLGLVYLIKFLSKLELSEKAKTIGALTFIISFPMFYYATSGYIDASLIGILLITNYYLFFSKYHLFIFSFLLGIFVKETIIIILPVATIYFLLNEQSKKKYIKILIPIIIYISVVIIIRNIAPQKQLYIWKPSFEIFTENISRVKTYLSFILTFGIPGILLLYCFITQKKINIHKQIKYPLITGIIFSFLLWFYSLFAAYSDGRQLWTFYVFSIPLSLQYLIAQK